MLRAVTTCVQGMQGLKTLSGGICVSGFVALSESPGFMPLVSPNYALSSWLDDVELLSGSC